MSPLRAPCLFVIVCLAARGCLSADCRGDPSTDLSLVQLAALRHSGPEVTWRLAGKGEACSAICSASGETCDVETLQSVVDKQSTSKFDYPSAISADCVGVASAEQAAVPGTYGQGDCRFFGNDSVTASCETLPEGPDFRRWCPCDGGHASGTGDPHIRNVLGQKFEMRRAGTHTFMSIPKGATGDAALLRMDALVEPEESACSAMFIRRLHLAGQWLRAAPTLTFSAGAGTPGSEGGPGLHVGNSSSLTMQEFTSRVPSGVVQLSAPQRAVEEPMVANRHATSMTASLKLGTGVGIKVSWVAERTPAMSLARSLWVSITGLSTVHDPIGGLLGTDDHYEASTLDPSCVADKRQRANYIAFGEGYTVASADMQE